MSEIETREDLPAISPEVLAIVTVLAALNQRELRKKKRHKTLDRALEILQAPIPCLKNSLGQERARKGAIAIIKTAARR